MALKLQQQLRDVGSKLENPPASKDALIKLLKQAANSLSEVEQSPLPSMLDAMKPCLNATSKEELLKNQDRDVKVLVATCICEITRITAPEPPYSDDVLRDIFHLIVGTFSGLNDVNSPSFGRRVVILETVARYRSSVVMLDLDCDDLIKEMFSTFFSVVSDDHPKNVISSMKKIMVLILDESEDIPENLLSSILSTLGRKRTEFSLAARRLAMDVIQHCAGKLEPSIKQFLLSSLSGDNTCLNSSVDYHEVIYDVYQCASQILSGIVPYITGELLAESLDARLKAVKLLGELFSLPEHSISESFHPLFSEFLKRLTDRAAEVRISVIEHLKNCLISDPMRPEAPMINKSLCDRLLDFDENVRKQVVAAIFDVACHSLKAVSPETARLAAERVRDKSLCVKRYTMERLADLYKFHCLKRTDGAHSFDEFEWIPGKIVRCLYDKDFRSEAVELILCSCLFPPELSIKDRLKHWATFFSDFDKVEVKAVEQVLLQKQRLQQEMQKYLSLRQAYQEDAPELQKRISVCFRNMSRLFSEPTKAEENFQIFNQLKDVNIWKMLTMLLDPSTSFHQAWSCRDDLLKILGEKHPLYDFMGMLSTKCSYLLFNKEYVKELLAEVSAQKSPADVKFISSCMNLLAMIACFSPQLLAGYEEDLVLLLKGDNEIIKEGITHVLARAGGTIREQLAMTSSSVDLLLERLCLEGNRKQAKYSVQALAAINKDDGLKSLSVLYKRLVDMLEEKTHLPAILQSLGCIAQFAMPVFETREEEIVGFIMQKILECSNKSQGISTQKNEWNERSELCLLKIFAIKTLVKSYLPVRDAHLRPGIEKVMEILKKFLLFGDISKDIESSPVDKAHIRLASGKAVLRLSRQWDHKISLDVFYLTLRVSEDLCTEYRKLFISKVQQYIKERLLDPKYACTFLLNIAQFHSPEYEEAKHNLLEIVQICQQVKVRQISKQSDRISTAAYPEYILVYLVHALAHHPLCPTIDERDVKAFEPIYWRLHLFLSVLLHGDEGAQSRSCPNKMKERYATTVSIFNNIKCSEDALDGTKTKISHAISDLGLSIAKRLVLDQADISGMTTSVALPSVLYKPAENIEGEKPTENGEHSWLGGDTVSDHFEALKFKDKETSVSDGGKDEMVIEEKDGDGKEMPLGKLMKILKLQGAKKKKNIKKHTLTSDTKELESELDILGMVREISLDKMKTEQREIKEVDEDLKRRQAGIENNEETLISWRMKESNGTAVHSVSTPKRKRSASGQRSQSKSTKGRIKSGVISYSLSNKMDKKKRKMDTKKHLSPGKKLLIKKEDVAATPDLSVSPSPTIRSASQKDADSDKHKRFNLADPEKSINLEDANEKVGKLRISTGSLKKRKVRSVSVLAKCSAQGTLSNDEELVGSRIKVWWPLDKVFYEGVVESYDPGKKKHVVHYDDGEKETLRLDKERWELVTHDMPRKKPKTTLPSLHNEMSSKTAPKITPSSSRQKKKSSKKVQRRPAPKKIAELNSLQASENEHQTDENDIEGRGDSDLLDAHSHSGAEVDVSSGGHEGVNKSPPEAGDEIEAERIQSSDESMQEEKPDATGSRGDELSDGEPRSRGDEISDDEPLSACLMRAGKRRKNLV